MLKRRISGWGGPAVPAREVRSEDLASVVDGLPLTRGLGRSYGDSSLPAPGDGAVAGSRLADRILSFDPESGAIRVEAGLSVLDLNRTFLRRGFFLPVTPGTQFVTVGGMVASDVHGKNHHRDGTFGRHVTRLRVRTAGGADLSCSRREHPDLFLATIGGMGLTGHVLEVEFKMVRIPSPWITGESERVPNVEEFVAKLRDDGRRWPFTMGWLDTISGGRSRGRGILMRGRWATREEAPRSPPPPKRRVRVPFPFPRWVLGRASLRLFNEAYFRSHLERRRRGLFHPESFFYPLDALLHWNRLYGRRGMTQYQCVLPDEAVERSAPRRLLRLLAREGGGSFLCVIKDCGPEGDGVLSFPMRGITIAIDLPVGPETEGLVRRLNRLVIGEGGRIYLTKDRFTSREDFARMEPRLARFLAVRAKWDPRGELRSAQSRRLLDGPDREDG